MNAEEIWKKLCELLRGELVEITYRTMIENNLYPVKLENDTLVLRIAMEKMRVMVNNRYVPMLEKHLAALMGRRINVSVLTKAEIDADADKTQPTTGYDGDVQLNPNYTFDTFVVGNGNRLAHAAALAVAEAPAEAYNPLFIYGGVGLGKTHLMHAIGHYVQEQYPEKRLLYITSETFMNELITAIQQNRNIEFRQRFRNVDILMVDDIQFIAGRETTQEEFFHTFNTLYSAGKQIILTSDRHPQNIAKLEERLASRFAWGLMPDISRPDIDTRVAILREKAKHEHLNVPDDVIDLIAANVDSNIRELEGCLNRVVAYARLVNKPIDLAMAQDSLKELLEKKQHRAITAAYIIQSVADFYGLKAEDITGPARRREIVVPRQIAIHLTRELTSLSLPQIGAAFGNRDHSTILHSLRLVEDAQKDSPDMVKQISDIRRKMEEM